MRLRSGILARAAVLAGLLVPVAAAADGNPLADAPSPYLRQHADNPVDWRVWGPEALAEAKASGKPIFVSVGYSSCHWCHVMREESFENEAVARLLNEHFVAIKIDRETRPDLDARFMAATEFLNGAGGWPNNLFLTPEGDPFFAGVYFPPDVFIRLLEQVVAVWEDDPEGLRIEAEQVSAAVAWRFDQAAPAREATPEAVSEATAAILEHLDPFHGGFGEAQKFPLEPLQLFLLDEAERNGDSAALEAVTLTLDNMILGGIHDHVGGGFHRYTVDPAWREPHFEKMLYDQALIGRLLTRLWRLARAPRHARAARRLFDHVLADLAAPEGGFFAALDADSAGPGGERMEGAFYTWTPEDLAPLGSRKAAQAARLFGVDAAGEIDGRNVLALDAPPDKLATSWEEIDALLAEMRALRATRPAPFRDEKVVASWAALMAATLAEAGAVFGRPDWGAAADRAGRFLMRRLTLPDGGRARIWFEGRASTPAQLSDRAALGLMTLALHDAAEDAAARAEWLAAARELAEEILSLHETPEGGLRETAGPGEAARSPVEDAEIPSGAAMALEFLSGLARRAPAPEAEHAAARLADAFSGLALEDPFARAYALKAVVAARRGEVGDRRFAARGAVEARLVRAKEGGARLSLRVAPGWHVNAHEPLQDYLVPTSLTLDGKEAAAGYPAPAIRRLGFASAPLAVYEGAFALDILRPAATPARLSLTLQACSDEMCLQPEELRFTLW